MRGLAPSVYIAALLFGLVGVIATQWHADQRAEQRLDRIEKAVRCEPVRLTCTSLDGGVNGSVWVKP